MSVIDFKKARKWLEKRSALKIQSTVNTSIEETGQICLDVAEASQGQMTALASVYEVLFKARTNPFTTKSNTAREAADIVAMLAVSGFLTTKLPDGDYVNVWMITPTGIKWMEMLVEKLRPDLLL